LLDVFWVVVCYGDYGVGYAADAHGATEVIEEFEGGVEDEDFHVIVSRLSVYLAVVVGCRFLVGNYLAFVAARLARLRVLRARRVQFSHSFTCARSLVAILRWLLHPSTVQLMVTDLLWLYLATSSGV